MNRHTGMALVAVALLTSGCLGNLRPAAQAEYDFGPLPAIAPAAMTQTAGPAGPVRIGVTAPSWLAGTAMHYRLLHADPAQRHAYADSRWAAPPAELLRLQLQRRLAGADFPAGCRLRLQLVEFEQVFTAPADSHVRLAARAMSGPKLQLGIDIEEAAPTPDARGGVAAAGRAVERLASQLTTWLALPGTAAQCLKQGGNENGQ